MPTDPHAIPLADAIRFTTRWRKAMPEFIRGGRFDRIAFDTLLAQPGTAGIRIYQAINDDGAWTYVMVGTDRAGNDIIPKSQMVEDLALPCPPLCSINSPLNGT